MIASAGLVSGASGTARGLCPSAGRAIRRCGRPDLGAALPEGAAILPAQALGALFNVLTRKPLLSEDLQHGFIWRGVTAVNPFAESRDALLVRALQTR